MAKRNYEVSAPSAVLGHGPGESFEADLDPVQEARLLAGGALKVKEPVVAPKAPAKAAKPDPSE